MDTFEESQLRIRLQAVAQQLSLPAAAQAALLDVFRKVEPTLDPDDPSLDASFSPSLLSLPISQPIALPQHSASLLSLDPDQLTSDAALGAESGWLARYQDLGVIGRGGMGEVRRVFDRDLNRSMAMKILLPHAISNKTSLARFIEEAQTTAQLQHPGIVPVHEI